MRGFAPTLPFFTQLESLNFTYNNHADEGVELLAKCLLAPFFILYPSGLLIDGQEISDMIRMFVSSSTIVPCGTVHKL